MCTIITGNCVNELNMKGYDLLLNSGKTSGNRNSGSMGDIHVEYDVNLVLENPMNRHLNLNGRKSNIFALIGETIWVLGGRDDTEYLLNFLPRANDFSDDGKTWRAGYGPRFYQNGQFENMIEHFLKDGLYTRRSTLSIYDPHKDTKQSLKENYGLEDSKDICCNQWMNFYVSANDDRLHMKVIQRSGDILWGTGSINLFEFSTMYEVVYGILKSHYPQLKMGTYNQSVSNLHMYEATASQAENALELTQKYEDNKIPVIAPTDYTQVQPFFMELSLYVEGKSKKELEEIFNDYDVTFENNLLYWYAYFSAGYVHCKRNGFKNADKDPSFPLKDLKEIKGTSFYEALVDSSFRNFEL